MKYILLCVLFFTHSVTAFDQVWFQQNVCDQVIKPGKSAGFYRIQGAHYAQENGVDYFLQRDGGDYVVKSKNGVVTLRGEIKRALDFTVIKNHFWVVGETGLIEFDQQGEQKSQYTEYKNLRGIFYHPIMDKIYIAGMSSGLIVFDYYSRTFEKNYVLFPEGFPGLSYGVSVTGDFNGNIYLAASTGVEGAFSGIVSLNPSTEELRFIAFDPIKAGVIDTYATIHFTKGKVVLNNGGWVHQLSRSQLIKDNVIPDWNALTYTAGDTFQYVQFRGDLIIEQNSLYGCSIIREKVPGEKRPVRYGKVFSLPL